MWFSPANYILFLVSIFIFLQANTSLYNAVLLLNVSSRNKSPLQLESTHLHLFVLKITQWLQSPVIPTAEDLIEILAP